MSMMNTTVDRRLHDPGRCMSPAAASPGGDRPTPRLLAGIGIATAVLTLLALLGAGAVLLSCAHAQARLAPPLLSNGALVGDPTSLHDICMQYQTGSVWANWADGTLTAGTAVAAAAALVGCALLGWVALVLASGAQSAVAPLPAPAPVLTD